MLMLTRFRFTNQQIFNAVKLDMQTESSQKLIDFNDKLIRNESDGIFPKTDIRFIRTVIISQIYLDFLTNSSDKTSM